MGASDLIRGRQTATRTLTNRSGGAVALGDVVVIGDETNDNAFTTTTTASFNARMVGVAMEAIANAAAGLVAIHGYVPKLNSAAGLTRDHFLFTSATAKEATGSATRAASAFGQVLESATDPEAVIWGMPDPTAGSTDLAGKELDYVQITADVSITGTSEGAATTIITGTSQAYSAVLTLVEFFSADVRSPTAAAGNAVVILLYDGATLIGRMGVIITPVAAILGWAGTLSYRLTPTAATHQYIIKAHVSSTTGGPIIGAGAGGAGTALPAFLRITRVAS